MHRLYIRQTTSLIDGYPSRQTTAATIHLHHLRKYSTRQTPPHHLRTRGATEAMGTYSPATFPRRPTKNSNIFTEAYYQLQLAYYRYEVNTGLYVMSTAEKIAFNLVLLSLVALCLAAIHYCLPRAAIEVLSRIAYYATGSYKMPTPVTKPIPELARRIIQGGGEAVASLANGGTVVLNASQALMP